VTAVAFISTLPTGSSQYLHFRVCVVRLPQNPDDLALFFIIFFILNTKENTEVFSFCDEFGNYFSKNIKKVPKTTEEENIF